MTEQLPASADLALVCGLGNSPQRYFPTRHNAGFWLTEKIAARHGVELAPKDKLFARHGKGDDGIRLACPTGAMNESGRSVRALLDYFDLDAQRLLVIHDELDLAPGTAKLKFAGGHAGHNGLRSIFDHTGTDGFWRLRIGIGHPRDVSPDYEVSDWVLANPSAADKQLIDAAIEEVMACWDLICTGDMEAAMKHLHGFKAQ